MTFERPLMMDKFKNDYLVRDANKKVIAKFKTHSQMKLFLEILNRPEKDSNIEEEHRQSIASLYLTVLRESNESAKQERNSILNKVRDMFNVDESSYDHIVEWLDTELKDGE